MGKTSAEAKNRYRSKAYDQINIVVPKGQKDIIKSHAKTTDGSINKFVNRAITETMKRDSAEEGKK